MKEILRRQNSAAISRQVSRASLLDISATPFTSPTKILQEICICPMHDARDDHLIFLDTVTLIIF
jgi:hypothetical protein